MELRPYNEPVRAPSFQNEQGETIYVITNALSPQMIATAVRHRRLQIEASALYGQNAAHVLASSRVDMELVGFSAGPHHLVDVNA